MAIQESVRIHWKNILNGVYIYIYIYILQRRSDTNYYITIYLRTLL